MSTMLIDDSARTGRRHSSTSAAGAMCEPAPSMFVGGGGLLRVAGATTAASLVGWQPTVTRQTQTNSGGRPQASPAVLMELRRLCGFTWDQLAHLCGTTRQHLLAWASGRPLSADDEVHVSRLLACMRRLDRGSAQANRALLLSTQPDGSRPCELLAARRYEDVLAQLGPGLLAARPYPAPLSPIARAARASYAPEDIAGALPERVHYEMGRTRVPRLVRNRP